MQKTETPTAFTVSELTQAIKKNVEGAFPSIWLQGEVSNAKLHSSGHFYFSLKDKEAQIAAVMFRGAASSLKQFPKNGDQVLVHGGLNIWPPSGRYQIVVDILRPVGVGELLLKLEELKQKLLKLGYFKKEHKKPLPKFPKTIGIVTSPTGAAIQDILNILTRRFSGFHVILSPVKVQGEGAAEEISQAIEQFNQTKLVNVMIVGRGGGSLEDLWAFNEEIVAQAIFKSEIPIICAVGHETDHSIAEYVADVRAPTPSAAAEIVLGEKGHLLDQLVKGRLRLNQTLRHLIKHEKRKLSAILKQPLFKNPYALLGPSMQQLDVLKTSCDQTITHRIAHYKTLLAGQQKALYAKNPITQVTHLQQKFNSLKKQIDLAILNKINQEKEKVKNLVDCLILIDPKNLLKKGYSILFSKKDDSVIKSIKQLKPGLDLKLLLQDGEAIATTKEISTLY